MVRGSNLGMGNIFFHVQNVWGPLILFSQHRGPLSGVKRSGREVSHSHPLGAEISNEWNYKSAHRTCLHGKEREDFTFTFYLRLSGEERGYSGQEYGHCCSLLVLLHRVWEFSDRNK
jgi:hypothetical protein